MQKGNTLIFLLIGILILAGVAGGAYYFGKSQSPKPQNTAVSSLPTSSVTPSISPDEVVKTFYNTWLNCEKEFDKYALKGGPISQDASTQREECVKKAMADYTVIQKEHPTDNKMWCAQSFPARVDADKANIVGNTATVVSHHFFDQSGDNQIKVTLTLINNSWKISDTTCLSSKSDKSPDWITYVGKGISFKYPKEWKLAQSDYLNTVSVTSPSGAVRVQVSEGQYPYGFEGPGYNFEKRDVNISVGDKDYLVKETIINGKKVFVDFPVNSPRGNNILFGTGYPAAEDAKASIEDYEKNKMVILEILRTFKFL